MRERWEYKKLGEVAQIVSGATPKTNIEEYWGQGHYWVTPAELNDSTIYVNKTERQITDAALAKTNLQILPKGTVLLSSRAPIGKVAICNTEMYCNQGFKNCICSEKLYNKYLFYYLKDKKEYLNSLGRGATFKEISKSIVENVIIPIPPKSTQLAIVSELDKINELIRLKKEQLVEYDNLAQSIFYEMFGDPVENEKGWDIKNMPELCEIIDGDRGKNYPKQNEFSSVGYCLFLNAKNVTKNGFCFDECFFVSKERDELLRKGKLERGDMVLTTRGTIGNIALYDNKVSFEHVRINSGMVILRMNKFMNNTMFAKEFGIFLDSIKKKIASGSAQPQLPISSMKKIKMIVPPLPLQQSFASRIEQIEKLKSEVQNAITDLETLLASRMQYWFD